MDTHPRNSLLGTPLIRFDREKIKAAGYTDAAVCIVTEQADIKKMRFVTGIKAEANTTIVAEFE